MDKKILIGIIVVILVVIGIVSLSAFSEDEFTTNIKEAGDIDLEISLASTELRDLMNDTSKKGISRSIELNTELINLCTKQNTALKKALDSTDNETIKKYLELAIDINKNEMDARKADSSILKSEQKYENSEISANELSNEYDKYYKINAKRTDKIKKDCKEIKNLLKGDNKFIGELVSYGFTGLFLGDFSIAHTL